MTEADKKFYFELGYKLGFSQAETDAMLRLTEARKTTHSLEMLAKECSERIFPPKENAEGLKHAAVF